jgi:putative spermidine/putrescine transport system substrate-binding protein
VTRIVRLSTAGAALAAACLAIPTASLAEGTLNIMNSGGAYGDALEECVNKPLMEAAGITVVTESPGGFAKLQAQARAGAILNTTSDASTGDLYRMVAEGLLEPIDWAAVNPEPTFEEAMHPYGFGSQYYSTIMAWRSDAPAPANFQEFFDLENFPGVRALPDYPDFVLPFAAMGGGATPEEVAQGVDLDLAFATLDRVKDSVIWWQSGAQPAQLLQDNEAQYAIAWSGRVLGQEGVEATYNQGMLDISWFVAAKGITDEQREMLYAWIRAQTNAEKQACVVGFLPYPGPSPDIGNFVTPAQAAAFPTAPDNKAVQWLVPGQWWFDNAAEIERRWNEFKLQ